MIVQYIPLILKLKGGCPNFVIVLFQNLKNLFIFVLPYFEEEAIIEAIPIFSVMMMMVCLSDVVHQ